MFGGEGSWWISSESDPRWNKSGRDFISGIHGPAKIDLYEEIKKMSKKLGKKPKDLNIGWMKD